MSSTANLVILGAAYGPTDVTSKVWSLVANNQLTVTNNSETFGPNPWPLASKISLVVVYQYTGHDPQVGIAGPGKVISVTPPQSSALPPAPIDTSLTEMFDKMMTIHARQDQTLEILGAAYGLLNVTSTAAKKIENHTIFNQVANNATWTDGWLNVHKTFVIVYKYDGITMLAIVKEDETMSFRVSPPLSILGAAYGPEDVTTIVRDLVKNRSLTVTADPTTFHGDPWYLTRKTLVIVYQYGEETPQVAITEDFSSISFMYVPDTNLNLVTDPEQLTIVGAAYGPTNITSQCSSHISNNNFNVTVNHEVFGNPWPEWSKTLVVVYQYGSNQPLMSITKIEKSVQTTRVSISKDPAPVFSGLLAANSFLRDNDVIRIMASNNKYLGSGKNSKLLACLDNDGLQLTVTKPTPTTVPFYLKIGSSGYVTVGTDGYLYSNGTESNRAQFTIAYSMSGGFRLAVNNKYIQLNRDTSLIPNALDSFLANTAFDIAFSTPASLSYGISLEQLSPHELAQLQFIWHLMGGFFIAIGLGSFIKIGQANPALVNLLRTNDTVWIALSRFQKAVLVTKNIVSVTGDALDIITLLYSQNLLWDVLKFFLMERGWYLLTRAVAKIIQVVFQPPGAGAALFYANAAIWVLQLIKMSKAMGNEW